MENQPGDVKTVKDDSDDVLVIEPPPSDNAGDQQDGGGGGRPQFGGPRRGGGGGPNRFGGGGPGGNRRPGPYNNRGGGGGFGRGGGGDRGGDHGGGDHFNRRRPGGPGGPPHHNDQGGGGGFRNMDKFGEKMANLQGPTFDLPPLEVREKRFNGRTRLYLGNLPQEVTDEEIQELFAPYGETSEFFFNREKNFGFIRLEYRSNAEKAKQELDGSNFKGKSIKIRFAPNGSTIKVKNLTGYVSNELLAHAFHVFGEIERAYVVVDERGKPTTEGIVEFARKGCALHAIRKCSEGCYFLTASLRPCIVEGFEPNDDSDGYPEKSLPRKNHDYMQAREVGPRFANPNSFEFEFGTRWKQMHELFAQKELALKKEFDAEKEKLEAQMEFARYEHETEMLRNQLRAREMDRDRQKQEWEIKERFAEEQRQRNEEQMRRQQEEMQSRIHHQDEELRRRQQENNLFVQAHQLTNMLDQQEQAYDEPSNNLFNNDNDNNQGSPVVVEPKVFMNQYKRNNQRFEGRGDMGSNGPRNGGGRGGGHWAPRRRQLRQRG